MPFQVIPRELAFYELLDAAAKNVAEGAGELLALVDDLCERRSAPPGSVSSRATGDDITHQIITS